MKMALVKPPATYADWYRRPVLGISYISSYLEANGKENKIFDSYYHSWSFEELCQKVIEYRPDIIGISSMTHEIALAAKIAGKIKQALDIPVIVGGSHATAMTEETLREFPHFDYLVYGEGERTTLELINSLSDDRNNITAIKGICYRNDKQIVNNGPRKFLTAEELDQLPYPAYYQYFVGKELADKGRYYTMFTTRGCPYGCVFCMQVLGRKVRRRSSKSVIAEIEYAQEKYGAYDFDFADEIFLFDCKETREILNTFCERKLFEGKKWSGLTRANFVDEELIALAKKAGCAHLEMGVESGDDEILKFIGKGITVQQVRKAVKIIKSAGISLCTYFILGHPQETRDSLKKTIDLAVELNSTSIAVGLMVPYPGTKVYEYAQNCEYGYKLISKDWSQYDKYGGRALELKDLPYEELLKWQKKAYVYFYIKNFRLKDAVKFIWTRKRALWFFLRKKLTKVLIPAKTNIRSTN